MIRLLSGTVLAAAVCVPALAWPAVASEAGPTGPVEAVAAASVETASGVAVTALRDTVVAVRPGEVVRVDGVEGRVVVEGGPGANVEVRTDGWEGGVEVVRRNGGVGIRPWRAHEGFEGPLRLRVPDGVAVEVHGREVDVVASDLRGDLRVDVVEGDLRVTGASGSLDLRTFDGDIEVSDARSGVRASTVDGRVRLAGVRGVVVVETMDGDLVLDDVEGPEVAATTTDGDVRFRGRLPAGSRVRLTTHDGDVVVEVPPGVSAEVEVATFDGEFLPGFPVRVGRVEAGRPLRFRLGAGEARLEVKVFDGDIQLRHGPGR